MLLIDKRERFDLILSFQGVTKRVEPTGTGIKILLIKNGHCIATKEVDYVNSRIKFNGLDLRNYVTKEMIHARSRRVVQQIDESLARS